MLLIFGEKWKYFEKGVNSISLHSPACLASPRENRIDPVVLCSNREGKV